MSQRITRQGESSVLLLDDAMLKLLDINEQTPLQVTTDGRRLIIEPMGKAGGQGLSETMMDRIERDYDPMFKRLAE